MAKLYWRVKRDGKWTWRAANEKCPCCGESAWNMICDLEEEEDPSEDYCRAVEEEE